VVQADNLHNKLDRANKACPPAQIERENSSSAAMQEIKKLQQDLQDERGEAAQVKSSHPTNILVSLLLCEVESYRGRA
jgi:hypothetical protein